MFAASSFNFQLAAPLCQIANVWNSVRAASHVSRRQPSPRQSAEVRVTAHCPDAINNSDIINELKSFLSENGLVDMAEHIKVEDIHDPILAPLVRKTNLNDFHWVSSQSFFENKTGFTKEDLGRREYHRLENPRKIRISLPINRLFAARSTSQPLFQQTRGFFTIRAGNTGIRQQTTDEPVKSKTVEKKSKDSKDSGDQTQWAPDPPEHLHYSESEFRAYQLGYQTHRADGKERSSWHNKPMVKGIASLVIVVLGGLLLLNFVAKLLSGEVRGVNSVLHPQIDEVNPETVKVKFDDVKGCDEVKEELVDIVNFLKYPEKFNAIGARLPKGVLLVGQPGIGKTLLAKAVAGEANVPFFQASGSEFDEIFVGTGAKKVRALFEKARTRAPCVIFIDEIDSVGAKRTNTQIHPYANQTINQLLSEMDGFNTGEGVIVLGATNKVENLDKALLRPGRFDVRVQVHLPDKKGREEIIKLYLDKVKSKDIDVEGLAKRTVGFSGAELENMINQAALKAVLDNATEVLNVHIEWAKDKIVMGPAKKNKIPDEETNRNTAYHEAGHTLVALYTPDATPVHKVTIMPRGQSLGHTAFTPDKDQWGYTKSQLLAELDVAMGGRVAEEIIFGEEKVTTGASSDFEKATAIAEAMVMKYGMSKQVGHRSIHVNEYNNGTEKLVTEEVKRLLDESYERAKNILDEHRPELECLCKALLEHETLDANEVKMVVKTRNPASPNSKRIAHQREKQKSQKDQDSNQAKKPKNNFGW